MVIQQLLVRGGFRVQIALCPAALCHFSDGGDGSELSDCRNCGVVNSERK